MGKYKELVRPLCEKRSGVFTDIKFAEAELSRKTNSMEVLLSDSAKFKAGLEKGELSLQTLRAAIDLKSRSKIESLEGLCTLALRTVFFDRNYTFRIVVEEKRGLSTASFRLEEELQSGHVVDSSLDGEVGGSIRTVIGFVLQVYYIGYFDLSPVLFMDESLTALSDLYVESFVDFMRELVRIRGFAFVMVSHDPRFNEFADRTFEVAGGTATEI